jgi:hypothetical protein
MSRHLTQIASALALAFATAASAQQVVYTHDFDSVGGWPDSDVSGDLTAVYTVVGSEYLINPLKNMAYALAPAPASSPSPNMVVEADVRMAASQSQSRAGIACRVGRDGSFYAFNMIASGGYEIVRIRKGDADVLASGSIDFDPYEGARLKAVCSGAQLSFFANGSLLDEATDNGISANGAGLLSVSPVVAATNAAFDNFSIASLGGSASAGATATLQSSSRPVADAGNGGGDGGGSYGGDLPLIEEMALYADDGAGKPGSKRSLFDSGRQRVYLVMDMDSPVPANFRAQWIAVRGSDESTVLNGNYDSPGNNRRVWLYADRDWTPGLYRVDVYANGQLLDQREFSVY